MFNAMLSLYHLTSYFFRIMSRVRAILMLMFVWIVIGAVGIAYTEKISFGDALYFSFITGLTIGYSATAISS